ncbi:metallophosphoesterase [Mitsuokella sp.]|uniref:metallophosphoesterase n=1 Tax=Mitsuokella sp. TaxID=2049034 RepID=UPI003D7C6C61
MALFALGDFHLSFQVPDKSMDVFGPVWHHHEEKIRKNCTDLISPDDTLVVTGDHSWGRKLPQCTEDLGFIESLPGRKILLRGNHDMFWDAKKTASLNRQFEGRLSFLQNNFFAYEDYALVGTKGYTFEGPFYLDRAGRIIGWDEENEEHAQKLVAREAERLRVSFEAARRAGFEKFIMFLHYPPTNILEKESIFTKMAEDYGAGQVIYSHCHGKERFHDSIEGNFHGIDYHLVSGDYRDFQPLQLLP